jgi:site-specific recombinase XerD
MNATNIDGASDGLPTARIDAFLERLRTERYSEATLCNKRWVLSAFSRWMTSKSIVIADLDESAISLFMKRLSRPPASRVRFEISVLRKFLAYLRNEAIVGSPAAGDQSAIERIHGRYMDYLRQDRGLAKNSVLVYAPFIRDFLNSQDAGNDHISTDAFDAITIRNHLIARSKGGRSGEYMRLMAVALRSFCHFLFLRGYTPRDQYESVPTVRKYRQSSIPTFLTPEQEEVLISSADRSSSTGRRDYAILLLLARLGLRAGEIVALELDDIRWRSAELVIHGKGQMVEHVPLLSDVGEALSGSTTQRRDRRFKKL